MSSFFCKGGTERNRWAVSLCLSSAMLLALESLHPDSCVWMGLGADQTFALSASLATLSVFLATFLLTQMISRPLAAE